MRRSPHFAMKDPEEVKRLIRRNPWASFVSMTERGLVASHYPIILDEEASAEPGEIVIVSHFGLPDDRIHELGRGEILVIVQGPHDYVSSSWYPPEMLAPTWNHLSAHLHGIPELLSAEENFAMLAKLTEHFEQHYPGGRSLFEDEAAARKLATGTVGLRMRVDRFEAQAKLSQNKPDEVRDDVEAHLAEQNPRLVAEIRRVRDRDQAVAG